MSHDDTSWPFEALGLTGTCANIRAVKRAYARKLRTIDQATQAAEFQELRQAYQIALVLAGNPNAISSSAADPFDLPTMAVRSFDPDAAPANEAQGQWPLQDETATPLQSDIDRLAGQVPALTAGGGALASDWRVLLDDPLLDNPEVAAAVGAKIAEAIRECSAWDEDGVLSLPGFVNRDLMLLLDRRFGWLSDYRTAPGGWLGIDGGLQDALLIRHHGVEVVRPPATIFSRLPWPGQTLALLLIYISVSDIFYGSIRGRYWLLFPGEGLVGLGLVVLFATVDKVCQRRPDLLCRILPAHPIQRVPRRRLVLGTLLALIIALETFAQLSLTRPESIVSSQWLQESQDAVLPPGWLLKDSDDAVLLPGRLPAHREFGQP